MGGLEREETEDERNACEAETASFNDLCKTVKGALGEKVEKVHPIAHLRYVHNCFRFTLC
jgi:hypothetical protein